MFLSFFMCCRHCGYIKAKQDPDEEKMQFHNGRGTMAKIAHTNTHTKHSYIMDFQNKGNIFRGNINVKRLSSCLGWESAI